MHKDMQNFEMNEDTDCSVRKQIMNRTNRKKGRRKIRMKMRKPGYIALAVLMAATLTLTGCSNVTEAKGSPTTEKEKVAEKTPQKRVKVIVENAAETAIETVRLVQKTEETENLEPELGAEEDTVEENTEGENETGTEQGKTGGGDRTVR